MSLCGHNPLVLEAIAWAVPPAPGACAVCALVPAPENLEACLTWCASCSCALDPGTASCDMFWDLKSPCSLPELIMSPSALPAAALVRMPPVSAVLV